jgi:CHAT domain-containing protein/Tfp pilus assembly protein PilF
MSVRFAVVTLAAVAAVSVCAQESEEAQRTESARLYKAAYEASQLGKHREAVALAEKSHAIRMKLYPAGAFPDGHLDLTQTLNLLGVIWQEQGDFATAIKYFQQVVESLRRLYPPAKYPDGHRELASGISNLPAAHWYLGALDEARRLSEQSVEMTRKLYPVGKFPNGHVELATALNNLAAVLSEQGAYELAQQRYEETLTMLQKLYPESRDPDVDTFIATTLNNLARMHSEQGAYEHALVCSQRSTAMLEKLYPPDKFPKGHPNLAVTLGGLGESLRQVGAHAKALPYMVRSAEMWQRLFPVEDYPQGHPSLAVALNNLGALHWQTKATDRALDYYKKSLDMKRRLFPKTEYPNGHLDIAIGLNNVGTLLREKGDSVAALDHLREAMQIMQKFFPAADYPDGHPDLAMVIENIGHTHFDGGKPGDAIPFYEQALQMLSRLARRVLAVSSEAEALSMLHTLTAAQHAFLSACRLIEGTDAKTYESVWELKGRVTQALEIRNAETRAAGAGKTASLARLRDIRRMSERLLQGDLTDREERNRRLASLALEQEQLERALSRELPILARWQERLKLRPDDLAKALPANAVFVDFFAYLRTTRDHTKKGVEGEIRTPCYAAFVVTPGRPAERIELGDAQRISQAISAWRKAIDDGKDDRRPARAVADLVWQPVAARFPANTQVVYLSNDGDLARIPWPALPGAKNDSLVLEQYATSLVPHGQFLLEQLRKTHKSAAKESILAVGAVDYGDKKDWPFLPATSQELRSLHENKGERTIASLTGLDAKSTAIMDALPKAQVAHFATHGFFDEKSLTAEKQFHLEVMQKWKYTGAGAIRLTAAKNPLGFTGLVLSGGAVVTGLSIVDLDLSQLRLVTLSACETGLGEMTGGEGVMGLQRAFHLAGCPNVVSSLWKVNDAATAALMAKFYHELWVNKQEPLAALRSAQLTIYRHPERIPALAGERGKPDFAKTVELAVEPAAPARDGARRPPTKLWAAFILSGSGR